MSLLTLVIAAASAWSGWQQRRRAYGELMALDDRLLADTGLRRTDRLSSTRGYAASALTPKALRWR